MPWHFEMFAQFSHPVSRVSSQNFFLLQICLNPQGCLEPPLLYIGVSVLLGWVSIIEKGSFSDGQPLTFIPLGTLWVNHHKLWCPLMVVWAESFPQWSADNICTDCAHGQISLRISTIKVTSYSAVIFGRLGTWKMSYAFTLSFREITQVSFNFWSWVPGGPYIPADCDAGAGFGWEPGCWMQVAECPHTIGPTLGAKFVVTGVTSPFAGRWLMLWAHSKCRLKTLQWQLGLIRVLLISQKM